jgi:hypothetical protein
MITNKKEIIQGLKRYQNIQLWNKKHSKNGWAFLEFSNCKGRTQKGQGEISIRNLCVDTQCLVIIITYNPLEIIWTALPNQKQNTSHLWVSSSVDWIKKFANFLQSWTSKCSDNCFCFTQQHAN